MIAGYREQNITSVTNLNGAVGHPDWSADGTRIVFHRDVGSGEVYLVKPNGGGLLQLLDTTGSNFGLEPRWSPDGTRIIFTRSGQLWTMAAVGSDQVKITEDGTTMGMLTGGERFHRYS